jgi:hypothetical protein
VSLTAGVVSIAYLLSSASGLVRVVTGPDSSGIGGIPPLPGMHLAILAVLTGFAVLVHVDLADSPDQRPTLPIDMPSLILVSIVSCLCLLVSLWAASSATDLSATMMP